MKQYNHIVNAMKSNQEFVIATIVATRGSAPGKVGFRMVVFAEHIEGTVGGGALEKAVLARARTILLESQDSRLVTYDLEKLGMTCGGGVDVFYESCLKRPDLWIFGAGHIARALAPLMHSLKFRITVVDNRQGFAVQERFPEGTNLITGDYIETVQTVPGDGFAVIVTHGHAHDEGILRELKTAKPSLNYIGMIGSKRKVLTVLENLKKMGVKDFSNVYSPIGLKIGGDSPEEIAVSIAAEILGCFHGRSGLPHHRI